MVVSRFASSYNALNLLRNGGLDFLKDAASVPPFWTIEGIGTASQDNTFSTVSGEDPKVEVGAARYFKFILANTTPVVLAQEFLDRNVQMAFDEEFDQYHIGDNEGGDERITPHYKVLGAQVISGVPLTVSFSMRVLRGAAGVKIRMEQGSIRNGVLQAVDTVAVTANSSSEWQRYSIVIDPGVYMIKRLCFVVEKAGSISGLAEVHLGALQLSIGSVGELPYTGDPMADAIPKGTIVFAFGDVCPTGFEKLVFQAPPVAGRVFFKDAKPVSLTPEGEERHNHSDAEMAMNPEIDWSKLFLIPTPYGESYGTTPDSGKQSHQHELSEASHVPPTRDVILCRRL